MTEPKKSPRKPIDWSRVAFSFMLLMLGVLIGQLVTMHFSNKNVSMLLSTDKTGQLMRTISRMYVDSVDMSRLEDAAIRAALKELDPHSTYIPASRASAATESLEGNFSGVGLHYTTFRDTFVVVRITPGGPSEKAGLMAGDRIVAVGDTLLVPVTGSPNQISSLLRGETGTPVKVSIVRPGTAEPFTTELTRAMIPINSVDAYYMIDAQTAYLRLNTFSRNSAAEFKKAIEDLKSLGMTRLIFDLRDNTGGVMDAAIRISDYFLPPGAMIVYAEGRARPRMELRATDDTLCASLPLAIIINENSASASEIVAGAMQDNDRGIIVGRRSYGKGLIQEQMAFRDRSLLRLTVARYYTPTGRSIQKPYENGSAEYYGEIRQRIAHGELLDSDSVQVNDTLQFVTPGGRTVYGGGGIYPDVFVPVDTSLNVFYRETFRRQLMVSFAFEYTDMHRKDWARFSSPALLRAHLEQQPLLIDFHRYLSEQAKVKEPFVPLSDSAAAKMTLLLQAYIMRNLFDETAFMEIVNQADESVIKALDLVIKKND